MDEKLIELHSMEDLDRAIQESTHQPVLLFNHSLTCPISRRAYREVEDYLATANAAASYKLITVQSSRPLSDEVAARLRIPHESPQAILVRDGIVVWTASHYDITAGALNHAIQGDGGL